MDLEFKFDHDPMCLFCRHAKQLAGTEELLCMKCGPVSPEFHCKEFEYNLLARKVRRKKEINTSKYRAEDFKID